MKESAVATRRHVLEPIEVNAAKAALTQFEDGATGRACLDEIFVTQYSGAYEAREHELWRRLCERQAAYLPTVASKIWLDGYKAIGLDENHMPVVSDVSRKLQSLTGWELRPVTGYLPPRAFFGALARKIMPVTVVVRDPEHEGYLPEPDAFHDIFGHVPLCAHPRIAALMERMGKLGENAGPELRARLTSMVWFTIEFGLIREDGKIKILGAGLASSPSESHHCLESPEVGRLPFVADTVAQTKFEIDHFQPKLFVLDDLAQIDAYLDKESTRARGCGGQCKCGKVCDNDDNDDKHDGTHQHGAAIASLPLARDPLALLAVDHVRLHVGNALQARSYYGTHYGFMAEAFDDLTTGNRDEASHLMTQGDIRLLLTSGMTADHPASRDVGRFGDGVADIAFTVADAEAAYHQALRNGAKSAYEPRVRAEGHDTVVSAGVQAFGRVIHSFVSRRGRCGNAEGAMGKLFAPGFTQVASDPINDTNRARSCGLCALDHCVANVGLGEMNPLVDWYSEILGFKLFKHFDDKDISTRYSALMSKVMDSSRSIIKIPINEPAAGLKKSQVQEFLDWHNGVAGVQHLAFRTADALATVRELRRRGVAFLGLPSTYYEAVWARVEGALGRPIDEPHALVQELGLLLDSDDQGYLLQVFTKPVQDRPTLFIEIIGRKGATGFGKGNFRALFEALELEQERRGNL